MTGCIAQIAVRDVRRGERRPVEQVFAGLGARSRRQRFLGPKPRLAAAELAQLAEVGTAGRRAVTAYETATGRSIGIARYVRDAHDPRVAEVAFAVVDEWQGRGIGSRLARELARVARGEGIEALRAVVAHDNPAAIALLRRLGRPLEWRFEGSALDVLVAI